MVSPKRAIPSEAQEKHRQLYRDALTWRKALSLANRRYLDGYCIANWVVDSYHIPLPWSRFALKIYLQAIKFVLTDVEITPPEETKEKKESYETGDDANVQIGGTFWPAQTFTPLQSHKITSVKIKVWREGSPGMVYVGIKATDGEGKPTGDDLCSGQIDGNSVTPTSPGDFYEIELGDGYDLVVDTQYAIVARAPAGDALNRLHWRRDSEGTYPRGRLEMSMDSGVEWTAYPDIDMLFQEWETITTEGKKTATLHIRHPALMTVIHKRGELTVNGYDTLSSLDEEYLTGQVGVDVQSGDYLEATTLPGIKYTYQVG